MPRSFPCVDEILADDPDLAESLGITVESAARPETVVVLAPQRTPRPSFRFTTRLDGAFYGFRFARNTREARWYTDLLDASGTLIVAGIPMVTGVDLVGPYHGRAGVPPGCLVVEDTQGAGQEPGRFDFLARNRLTYQPVGDLPRLERIACAALLLPPPFAAVSQCVAPAVSGLFLFQLPGPSYSPLGPPPPPTVPGDTFPPAPFDGLGFEGAGVDAATTIVVTPSGQGVTINDQGFDAIEGRRLFSIDTTAGTPAGDYTFTARNLPDCDEAFYGITVACAVPAVDQWYTLDPPATYNPITLPALIGANPGTTTPIPPQKFAAGGSMVNATTVFSITPSGQGVTLDSLTFDVGTQRWDFWVVVAGGATIQVYDLVMTNPGCPGATVLQVQVIPI